MQMTFTPKTVFIAAVVVGAAYFGYTTFLSDLETDDVSELLRIHRDSSSAKKPLVKKRILAVYDTDKHYQLLYEAVDGESPTTQALAIEVLTAKSAEPALGKFIDTLTTKSRTPDVDRALAEAMGAFHANQAVVAACPTLIEMTDASVEHEVRKAAHDALVAILESGAQVKFGTGMKTRWDDLWFGHRKRKELIQRQGAAKKNKKK